MSERAPGYFPHPEDVRDVDAELQRLCKHGVLRTLPCVDCQAEPPDTWVRPKGFTGPCPECRSTSCPGYYKPDGNHFLPF